MPTLPPAFHPVAVDPEAPVLLLYRHHDGAWRYQWWDQASRAFEGRLATRDKLTHLFPSLLPALLADYARSYEEPYLADTPLEP